MSEIQVEPGDVTRIHDEVDLTTPASGYPAPAGLWWHADFLKLWSAQTISALGTQITLVALPLAAALVLDASPAQMGYLTAAGTLPSLLFGLAAGVVVDRFDRRWIMILMDLFRAAVLSVIPAVWLLDVLSIHVLYLVAFSVGIGTAFFRVAEVSFLPSIISRRQLVEGNSKLQASESVAQVVGPGMAGLLVGLISAPMAILLDAVSFMLSGALVGGIRHRTVKHRDKGARQSPLREAWEGVHTVFRHPLIRALLMASTTTAIFGWAFLAVYILYMTDDLDLGPGAIGLVLSLGGVGALIGAILAKPLAERVGIGRTIIVGQIMFGLWGMVIPIAVYFPSIALEMVLVSEFTQWMMLLIAQINALSVRQAVTPDRLLGRVNATHHTLVTGLIPVGALFGGWIGELFSVRTTLVVAVFGMLAGSLWVILSPIWSVRSTSDLEELESPE